MNKINKVVFLIFLLAITGFVTSCISTEFLMAKPKVVLFGDTYPPKTKDAKIDIYITKAPKNEYIEFAQITIRETDDTWNLNQIKNEAREIGADGVIIIGKANSYGVGVPVGNVSYISHNDYGMTAIAIKYKE